jgi:type IV pilus assembly protein PilQ
MLNGLFFSAPLYSVNLSLELQQVNLKDAIQLMAKLIGVNVIISPKVIGLASIHLNHAEGEEAFNLLLTSHGLMKKEIRNIWLIAPREDLLKQKEEELKWLGLEQETMPLNSKIWHIHYGKVAAIAQLLQTEHNHLISKRGSLQIDERTNSLLVQETDHQIKLIDQWIKNVDVPVKQVLIQAKLVSIDEDCERDLGIHFFEKEASDLGEFTSFNASVPLIRLANTHLLEIKLAALEKNGEAELISSPSLFTANQHLAAIEVGEEVPYQEVSRSGGTATAFKKAVLGLKVTPQILPQDKVLLQLQINQDRPSEHIILGVPTISTRQILTNILINSGETAVLGGIFETNKGTIAQRLPWISQIPIIGLLFKNILIKTNKRKLLIFVTPKVIPI